MEWNHTSSWGSCQVEISDARQSKLLSCHGILAKNTADKHAKYDWVAYFREEVVEEAEEIEDIMPAKPFGTDICFMEDLFDWLLEKCFSIALSPSSA